jgi:hypothetical protein
MPTHTDKPRLRSCASNHAVFRYKHNYVHVRCLEDPQSLTKGPHSTFRSEFHSIQQPTPIMSFPAPSRHDLPPKFPIIWQDDVRYDLARIGRVFNHRRPSRYPVAVVQPTNQDHVVEAVLLATKLGCRISIRSGGHSWAAWSVRDDAILIDFGKFNYFHLDDATGIASVSPNMTGRVINQLLKPHGRWFPGGHCPDVAVGGFLLQGGMGWNCKVKQVDG